MCARRACVFSCVRSVTTEIIGKVRADKPAYKVKMEDSTVPYYINMHPKAKLGEENVYLTHADVIVLAGEP